MGWTGQPIPRCRIISSRSPPRSSTSGADEESSSTTYGSPSKQRASAGPSCRLRTDTRSRAMKEFVRRLHLEVTQARHIPLSLDVFGVTATGEPSDIEALGQNLAVLGSEGRGPQPDDLSVALRPRLERVRDPGQPPRSSESAHGPRSGKLKAGHLAEHPHSALASGVGVQDPELCQPAIHPRRDQERGNKLARSVGSCGTPTAAIGRFGTPYRSCRRRRPKAEGAGGGDQGPRPVWRATMSSSARPVAADHGRADAGRPGAKRLRWQARASPHRAGCGR